MNTSTDSANTAMTMVTLTDNGETDSVDLANEEKIRITPNLLENALNQTPSSTDKEEDFFSASSNEEQTIRKSSEDLNVIFPKEDIVLEEYDDSIEPLLQHSTIPRPDETFSTVEDSKLPVISDGDPSTEWYNIKMRQQKVDATQKRALQTRRRLKLLSKKYSRCYFEEERVRNDKGRNSSGFAAEQMTIDSEDSFQWDSSSLASPPVPTSPTGSLTPTDTEQPLTCPSPTKTKQHFTFPPMTEANDLLNEYKVKVDKHRRQSQQSVKADRDSTGGSGGGELITKKLKIENTSSMTSHKPEEERAINKVIRNGNESGVATIVVQQPSVTGNSPDQQTYDKSELTVNNVRRVSNVFGESIICDKNAINYCSTLKQKENMKQMLDVTNTTALHQWQDIDTKYGNTHHNRSQSVRTPGSKSNVQVGINGTSRYRPNYLCLPQQRTRVASMPNTGVEEEYYRLRQFSISGKSIINRGDSLKSRRSRSNTSVASSNSSHSTEQVTVCGTTCAMMSGGGGGSSHGGTTSAVPSLPSSRESSCASCPGINPPFRVVMLGSSGVGKSSLVSQFMTSEYLQASGISIDEDFGEKSVCVSLDGEESEIIFIDQPSSKVSPIDVSNYESPHGYCVVYSTSDRESFQQAEVYLQTLWRSDSIRTKAVILVGNKTDLVRIRAVSSEEGSKMATSYDSKFIETSVGINHNVDELLVGILTQIRLKLDNPPDPSIPRDQYNAKKRSRSPLGNCAPRLYRGSRTSASLRVRKILSKVWSINSKSKSCENLHVL